MKIQAQQIKTLIASLLTILGITLTLNLPISTIAQSVLVYLDPSYLNNTTVARIIEDYTKSTLIFIILFSFLFYLYKNHKSHIHGFLKKHYLFIKGFGILYVAILAIVPVLKSSLSSYIKLSPYHHIFIYLVIIIVFFCVFISSFDENIISKQFRVAEIIVCLFLCLMGLGLFFFLMNSPN